MSGWIALGRLAWPVCKPSYGLPSSGDDFCYGWELKGTLTVYLGFLHLALIFPASPLLPALCLRPARCRPAGSAELLGTSQPVADLSSGALESGALASVSKVLLRYCMSG